MPKPMKNYHARHVEKMRAQKKRVVTMWLPIATIRKLDRMKGEESRPVVVKQAVDAWDKVLKAEKTKRA